MIIEGVDPRDISWEVAQPVYRVYFWHRLPAPPEVPSEHVGYRCEEYRLTEVNDVHEALRWVADTAGPEQTFTLYIEHDDVEGGRGLIHLAGVVPSVPD